MRLTGRDHALGRRSVPGNRDIARSAPPPIADIVGSVGRRRTWLSRSAGGGRAAPAHPGAPFLIELLLLHVAVGKHCVSLFDVLREPSPTLG